MSVPLYLVTMFAKNQKSDLSAEDKKDMVEFVKLVKSRMKNA